MDELFGNRAVNEVVLDVFAGKLDFGVDILELSMGDLTLLDAHFLPDHRQDVDRSVVSSASEHLLSRQVTSGLVQDH